MQGLFRAFRLIHAGRLTVAGRRVSVGVTGAAVISSCGCVDRGSLVGLIGRWFTMILIFGWWHRSSPLRDQQGGCLKAMLTGRLGRRATRALLIERAECYSYGLPDAANRFLWSAAVGKPGARDDGRASTPRVGP